MIKNITRKKKCKKAKWLSEKPFEIVEKRREVEGKEERERYTQMNAGFQRITRRYKKGFLNEQCKETEDNNRKNKTRDRSRKLETSREHFMQGWAQ